MDNTNLSAKVACAHARFVKSKIITKHRAQIFYLTIFKMSETSSLPSTISFATDVVSNISESDQYSATTSKYWVSRGLVTVFHDEPTRHAIDPASYFGVDWKARVQLWNAQWEKAPTTGIVHAHIYFELRRTGRMRTEQFLETINKVSPRNNVKFAKRCSKNQRQGAVNYTFKKESRIEDAITFRWSDANIKLAYDDKYAYEHKENKKDEKTKIIEHIMSRPYWWSWDLVLHEDDKSRKLLASSSWAKRFHEARKTKEANRRTIKNVIVLYGVGGSGKTTYALNYNPDGIEAAQRYYRRNYEDGSFWGGGATSYKNQSVVHLDEYNGQEKYSDFKEICDVGHHGKPVNVKNGGVNLNHDTVIITTNHHPVYWYHKVMSADENMWEPLYRRITQLLFFPASKPDGTKNSPTSDDDIYYVDQTQEWKSVCSTFDDAKEHAQKYWPRQEEEEKLVWTYSEREHSWLCNGRIPTAVELKKRV